MNTWSHSKLSTLQECKLKYKYSYVDKFKPIEDNTSILLRKGTAFHEAAEMFNSKKTKDDFIIDLKAKCKEYDVNMSDPDKPDYYDFTTATDKFMFFWDDFVRPKEKEGFVVDHELELFANFSNDDEDNRLLGYIDLILKRDKEIIIVDYKTGKSAKAADYKEQLITYAYLASKNYEIELDDIPNKISLYVFAPLMEDLKKGTLESNTKRSLTQLEYKAKDVSNQIIGDKRLIKLESILDWNNAEPKSVKDYKCRWCPYYGSKEQSDIGFKGCSLTSWEVENSVLFEHKTNSKS